MNFRENSWSKKKVVSEVPSQFNLGETIAYFYILFQMLDQKALEVPITEKTKSPNNYYIALLHQFTHLYWLNLRVEIELIWKNMKFRQSRLYKLINDIMSMIHF